MGRENGRGERESERERGRGRTRYVRLWQKDVREEGGGLEGGLKRTQGKEMRQKRVERRGT